MLELPRNILSMCTYFDAWLQRSMRLIVATW